MQKKKIDSENEQSSGTLIEQGRMNKFKVTDIVVATFLSGCPFTVLSSFSPCSQFLHNKGSNSKKNNLLYIYPVL